MDAALSSASVTALAAVGTMFVAIMGGLLHVIFRLGNLYNKVESMEKDIEELRRYVFPMPYKYTNGGLTPKEPA
jgi:hypothetical protein